MACRRPALQLKSRVALTLRPVCGLTTTEIARAFLDQEVTMGQRLSRAKAKIAGAGIAFAVPTIEHWPGRLDAAQTASYGRAIAMSLGQAEVLFLKKRLASLGAAP